MAVMRVNPTRMELTRLKGRLRTATRGHKLLKDKNDELMKQFLEIVRENMRKRQEVEARVLEMHSAFTLASAVMSPEGLGQALMLPKQSVELELSSKNIMGVRVPDYTFRTKLDDSGSVLPYGFASTTGELDSAVETATDLMKDLLDLAQSEKAASLLAAEIEKTRRRVNALEYVLIPQYRETIRYITMKLDENERGNITRLMKVKDMMIAQTREEN